MQAPKEIKWDEFKDVDPAILDNFKKAFAGEPACYPCRQFCCTSYLVSDFFGLGGHHLHVCACMELQRVTWLMGVLCWSHEVHGSDNMPKRVKVLTG